MAGNMFVASLMPETESMYIDNIVCIRAVLGLNVAVTYVSRNPPGFNDSSSAVRFVKLVMRMVDAISSTALNSWNMPGLGTGCAYSILVLQRKVPLK